MPQPTLQDIQADIAALLPDNNSAQITPADVRNILYKLADKMAFLAPNLTDAQIALWQKIYDYLASSAAGAAQIEDPANPPVQGNLWGFVPAGTYPALGNITVADGTFAIVQRVNGAWSKREVELPTGTPKQIVENAFGEVRQTSKTIGSDPINFSIYSSVQITSPLFNNSFVDEEGKITSIRVSFKAAGTVKIWHLNYDSIAGTYSVKWSQIFNVVAGLNTIPVDLSATPGDAIGFSDYSSSQIAFTDGGDGTKKYADTTVQPLLWRNGYIAANFTFENQTLVGYTVNQIKLILATVQSLQNTGGANNSVSQSSYHCRIFIEGQSNAFGVGFLSGLINNSPYKDRPIDWTKAFSRVFIWNPKSSQYENLQIGVNNIASWDAYYKHPAGVATAPSFGPEIGIALLWLHTHKFGNLYLHKQIGDGMPISYFQKGTSYYTDFLLQKTNADNWLGERGLAVEETGYLWVQGESDNPSSKNIYKSALEQLISDRKSDKIIANNEQIVLAQINVGNPGFGQGVYDAKLEYASENKTVSLINYSGDMNSDNVHLNHIGQMKLGMDAGKKILVSDNVSFSDLEVKPYWNL